jgi:Peptidase C39 family
MINIETGVGGRVYQIWKQQQASSCGVACAWMARGIVQQASFAEEEWDLAVRMYLGAVNTSIGATVPDAPQSFDPSAYSTTGMTVPQIQSDFGQNFAVGGLTTSQMATALRNEGMHAEAYSNNGNPCSVIHSKIAYNKPGISFVRWNGGGAHFIVIGRCTANHVTFLDPWTGHIREQPNNGRFSGGSGTGKIVTNIYVRA